MSIEFHNPDKKNRRIYLEQKIESDTTEEDDAEWILKSQKLRQVEDS